MKNQTSQLALFPYCIQWVFEGSERVIDKQVEILNEILQSHKTETSNINEGDCKFYETQIKKNRNARKFLMKLKCGVEVKFDFS